MITPPLATPRLASAGLFYCVDEMKTYYLQRNVSSSDHEPYRMMIDDHMHDGFEEVDECDVETWLQAREEFRKRHAF